MRIEIRPASKHIDCYGIGLDGLFLPIESSLYNVLEEPAKLR